LWIALFNFKIGAMMSHISTEHFTSELFDILHETFEKVQSIFLDKGTSLFETLDTIPAEVASRPVSENCASIAAQVEHIRYYLDILGVYMQGQKPEHVDWKEIWQTIEAVTPEEWEASKNRLQASYQATMALFKNLTWQNADEIGGAIAIVVHTAYHLGEIRQALCMVK
jgi:hypothetical protein